MQKNVLICPLYWGIGHATRMVHLTTMLRKRGDNIFIAAPEKLLNIFDIPGITVFPLSSPQIWYPHNIPLIVALLIQAPLLLLWSLIDRYRIERLVRRCKIDLLISDNRIGCRSRKTESVYLTHQVNIASPGNPLRRSRSLSALHRLIINNYDECWIPDNPAPDSVAGMLSDPSLLKTGHRYIGLLSYLGEVAPVAPPRVSNKPFYLLILSGPEPMKSRFAREVISLFKESDEILMVAGSSDIGNRVGQEIILGHVGPDILRYLIENSKGIICRSGYSTLMDLVTLGKSALLVPTPGQSEQEYLASYLSDKKLFSTVPQKKLTLKDIIKSSPLKR